MRIPENAMWHSSNGELIPVKEIVEMWNKVKAKQLSLSKDEERIILQNEIKFFENKYGGTYEKNLNFKEHVSEAELRDKRK